ncbi:TlpA family protein disulfide reductase [Ottowia pentelensis]|uniref:TlpA family protein disulfide reductase n=1 Tax=Ottowia pentelensis TaxID=511108 RepID=UPI003626DDE7
MPTRRQALAGLLLADVLPGARAQNVSKPWPAGQVVPPLAATDLNGRPWDLTALRGRAVLINFWATWCAPCKEEMPTLQTLADLEGERLAVLAVNVREPLPRVRRYVQSSGLTLTVLPDPKGRSPAHGARRCFRPPCWSTREARHARSSAARWTGRASRP